MQVPADQVRLGDRVQLGHDAPVIVVRVTRPSRGIVSLWHPDRTIEIDARIRVWIERREPRLVNRDHPGRELVPARKGSPGRRQLAWEGVDA